MKGFDDPSLSLDELIWDYDKLDVLSFPFFESNLADDVDLETVKHLLDLSRIITGDSIVSKDDRLLLEDKFLVREDIFIWESWLSRVLLMNLFICLF